MGLYQNNFAEAFSKLLYKYGVSCYHVHQYTHLDQAYLSRLKNGERKNPSSETIMKISLALCHIEKNIKLYDIEELFNSVGRSLLSIKN
ncbi:helix-turn-helix domain-containing protein [Chloroflexota bacterium]